MSEKQDLFPQSAAPIHTDVYKGYSITSGIITQENGLQHWIFYGTLIDDIDNKFSANSREELLISIDEADTTEIKKVEIGDNSIELLNALEIEFHQFVEIKQYLKYDMKKYEHMTLKTLTAEDFEDKSEEEIKALKETNLATVKQFKKAQAECNKKITFINDKVKEIKNEYEKPFLIVKNKALELVELYKEGKSNITTQLEKYIENQKEQKKIEIQEIFPELLNAYKGIDFVKFEMIFEEKYLNVTVTDNKIIESISNKLQSFEDDMKSINNHKDGARIMTTYLKNGYNVGDATQTVLEAQTTELEAQEHINANMKERGVYDDYIPENEKLAIQKEETAKVLEEQEIIPQKLLTINIQFTGTATAIKQVIELAKELGVKVEDKK